MRRREVHEMYLIQKCNLHCLNLKPKKDGNVRDALGTKRTTFDIKAMV